ncbi:hypothetical protein D2910_00495 [Planomicrobium okeanokoites]|nr:hypothetical protein D2910_00495 [Planomicrobium okeanokoites]
MSRVALLATAAEMAYDPKSWTAKTPKHISHPKKADLAGFAFFIFMHFFHFYNKGLSRFL